MLHLVNLNSQRELASKLVMAKCTYNLCMVHSEFPYKRAKHQWENLYVSAFLCLFLNEIVLYVETVAVIANASYSHVKLIVFVYNNESFSTFIILTRRTPRLSYTDFNVVPRYEPLSYGAPGSKKINVVEWTR